MNIINLDYRGPMIAQQKPQSCTGYERQYTIYQMGGGTETTLGPVVASDVTAESSRMAILSYEETVAKRLMDSYIDMMDE